MDDRPQIIEDLEWLLKEANIRSFFGQLKGRTFHNDGWTGGSLNPWQLGEHLRAHVRRLGTLNEVDRPGVDWKALVDVGLTLEQTLNEDDDEPKAVDTARVYFRGRWYKLHLERL